MRRSKFGWHYPPGAANDPNAPYNQPDRSHEHEWEPNEPDCPLFEDGAAVFCESCRYAEGRYGEGWRCEESRWLRCDLDRIIKVRDDAPNVAYLASTEDQREKWRHIEWLFEDALIGLERNQDDADILDCDPPNDYGDGFVRVQHEDYILEFRQ